MTSSSDPAGPLPGTTNRVDGVVNGPSVQAGTIHGGVHFHTAPPQHFHTTPPPPRPLYVPTHPIRASGKGPFLRKWGVALLPPLLVGVGVGGTVDATMARTPLGVRVLVDLAIFAAVALAVAAVARVSADTTVAGVLDRCTSKAFTALSTTALWCWLGFAVAMFGTGFGRELSRPPDDPKSAGANGALVALAVLGLLVGRLLARSLRK
ncbi:hypothetical protein [Umezawaea sp. Da 62-37]|uniref:hypothetical protein n=1 Tax=Umezawaea sp. Da 62-37 TaxID=3075927 RepID=UPI0028F7284F|nr:hypothetical protein [Umezawaea sp. Da 62-37]WNV84003.1 hypothetical protein RM788_38450 [Umezawaea sp. Da 62-37]